MNRIFSTCCFLLALSVSLSAQPTLTTAGLTPAIGETYEVQFAEVGVFDPGPGGANVTWDFSDLNLPTFELQFSILDPAETICGDSFEDADFVWLLNEFEAYNYYQVSDTGLDLIGGCNGSPGDITYQEVFSDVEDGLQLPMTYQDMYSYHSEFDAFFFGITSSGFRDGEVEVDGYGTIITPMGTYENVLRLVITSETTTLLTSSETQYAWMLPGQFVPVMVFTVEDDPEVSPSIYYAQRNETSATGQVPTVDYGVRIAANPVQETLTLNGVEQLPIGTQARIVNALGQPVYAGQAMNHMAFDQQPSGTYYLVFEAEEGRQVIPFIKS